MGFSDGILNVVQSRVTSAASRALSTAHGRKVSSGTGRGSWTNPDSPSMMSSDFKPEILSYPLNLGDDPHQGHYIEFTTSKYVPPKVSFSYEERQVAAKGKTLTDPMFHDDAGDMSGVMPENESAYSDKTKGVTAESGKKIAEKHIWLYMPPSVSVQYATDWSEFEVGHLAETASRSITAARQAGGSMWNMIGAGAGALWGQDMADTLKGVAVEAGLGIVGGLPGMQGAKELAQLHWGKIIGNRMELMFLGAKRRGFSFSFKLMPKSEAEAQEIERIVFAFKHNMMPKFEWGQRRQTIPRTFDIKYHFLAGQENVYMNRISTCVLKSMDVQYGGSRFKAHEPTNSGMGFPGQVAPPSEAEIKLSFEELAIHDQEGIEMGY